MRKDFGLIARGFTPEIYVKPPDPPDVVREKKLAFIEKSLSGLILRLDRADEDHARLSRLQSTLSTLEMVDAGEEPKAPEPPPLFEKPMKTQVLSNLGWGRHRPARVGDIKSSQELLSGIHGSSAKQGP